jgi:hypothetical protein
MLVFDSELFCIPAAEADVVELYRSSDSVSLSDEDAALPAGLSFVCVLKREGGYQVFVAFHLTDIKRSLVYAVDPATGGQPSYDAPLKKAFVFTQMMGFTMEAVNLKYGTAMREVVLRAVPALLSPGHADRLRRQRDSELAELEKLVADRAAEDWDPAGDSALSPDKQVELKSAGEKREEAVNAAARKLALEKRHTEQTETVGRAIGKFLARVNADEVADAERAERERLMDENSAMKARTRELEQTVCRLEGQVEAFRAKADRRIAELEQAVREAGELVESERFERELLAREKMVAEKRIAELELKVREGGQTSEPERTAQKQVESVRAEAEKRICELVKALHEAERRSAEARPSSSSQGGDVGNQIAGLKQALRKSEDRTEFLRLEMERIAAAKDAVERRLAELEGAGGFGLRKKGEGMPAPADSGAKRAVGPVPPWDGGAVGTPSPAVRRPPHQGAFFHADWDLTRIDYDSPEDILEVHQSMNLVQLSLEGYPSQHCSAHIVAMKKGQARQVHVAFGLSESGRALIYSPVEPIRNKVDYARTIGEAVKFLEVVGYMPEKMPLGKPPRALARDLSGIPVLGGSQKQAQGF